MLKKEEIKDGNIVIDNDDRGYFVLQDVGNAVSKGDRSYGDGDDELSYTTVNIITGKVHSGICEHSGMTQALSLLTQKEVDIILMTLEANALTKLGKAKKKLAMVADAMNKYSTIK